jgi:hypothetical protein
MSVGRISQQWYQLALRAESRHFFSLMKSFGNQPSSLNIQKMVFRSDDNEHDVLLFEEENG